jgi:hypothetical protein
MLELLGILSEPRFEHSGRDDRSRVRQDYRTWLLRQRRRRGNTDRPILAVRTSPRNGIRRAPSTHEFWHARDGALADRSSR